MVSVFWHRVDIEVDIETVSIICFRVLDMGMSEFSDLEGPRSDESTVHIVLDSNLGLKAVLTSRVSARSMKKSGGYRKTLSVNVVDGEAHIGDKLWFVCDVDSGGWPSAAYHSKEEAENRASNDSELISDHMYGGEVKCWNGKTKKLQSADDL